MRKVSRPKAGNESLSNQAYQQVRDEILSGELSIGDVLSRRWLTERSA
jgi:DNA-binding GntR family transcriptional regulator